MEMKTAYLEFLKLLQSRRHLAAFDHTLTCKYHFSFLLATVDITILTDHLLFQQHASPVYYSLLRHT